MAGGRHIAGGHARFDVWLVNLDPVRGSEIAKRRPCVVVSPEEMNGSLRTVVVVPLTSTRKGYPHRAPVRFGGVSGEAATEQLRGVDKSRLVRLVGSLDPPDARLLASRLVEMFTY